MSRTATDEDIRAERAMALARPTRWGPFIVIGLVGLALMTSTYTFAVGLALVLFVVLVLSMPSLLRRAGGPLDEHLRRRQIHAVDQDFIRFESSHLRARCPWSNLARWSRQHGKLFLWCRGMPMVVIPEAALVEAGCLSDVLALARRSASEGPRPSRAREWMSDASVGARVTRHVTEDELVLERAERVRTGRTWRGALGVAAVVLLGIAAMLASRVTFSCGLLLVLGFVFVLLLPALARWGDRRRRTCAHLAGEQEHGVGRDEIWFRTAHVELRSTWANLGRWQHRDGLLRLHCWGMPVVIIPEDALVEAGCFEEVMQLARFWTPHRAWSAGRRVGCSLRAMDRRRSTSSARARGRTARLTSAPVRRERSLVAR